MQSILLGLDTRINNYASIDLMQGYNYTLEAHITDNYKDMDLTGVTVQLQMQKPDKKFIIQTENIIIEGNKIKATLDKDFTREDGQAKLQVVLFKDDFTFGSWVVKAKIKPSAINDNDGQSENKVTITEGLINKISEAENTKIELDKSIANGDVATIKGNVDKIKDVEIPKINEQLETNAKLIDTINSKKADKIYVDTIKGNVDKIKDVEIPKINSQLDNNIRELDGKINEVAETGTTMEAVQNKVSQMAQDGTITFNTVTPEMTTFATITDTANLLNEEIRKNGFRGNTTNGGSIADSNYCFFGKVKTKPNTKYYIIAENNNETYLGWTQGRYINQYDANGEFIIGDSAWVSEFTTGESTYYIDISFNVYIENANVVKNKDAIEPYGTYSLENAIFNKTQVKEFNKKFDEVGIIGDFTTGYALNTNDGSDIARENYKVSNYYKCESNATYIIKAENKSDLTRTLEGAKNIAFYNNSKQYASSITAGNLYFSEFTVPNIVVSNGTPFFRIDTNINTNDIKIYKKKTDNVYYNSSDFKLPEDFKLTYKNFPYNYKNLFEKITNNIIASFGDSLTAGAGGGGVSYSSVLEELTGMRVENYGIGGEDVNTIASRQGGLTMMVNNIIIPPSKNNYVTLFKLSNGVICNNGKISKPFLQGYGTFGGINFCRIAGVLGEIRVEDGNCNFYRTQNGDSVTVNRPTPIITDIAYRKSYNKMIIFIGQNGGYDSVSEWISVIKNMVDFADCKDYIICGLTSGTEERRREEEKSFLNEFGRHYLNLRDYLSKYGLEDAGISQTQTDKEAMALGKTPPSLLVDEVHFNAKGYEVIANLLNKKGQELGYW